MHSGICETSLFSKRQDICQISRDLGPLLPTWINFNLSMDSNYTHAIVWDDITNPFPDFTCATREVWEGISNFIFHFINYVII